MGVPHGASTAVCETMDRGNEGAGEDNVAARVVLGWYSFRQVAAIILPAVDGTAALTCPHSVPFVPTGYRAREPLWGDPETQGDSRGVAGTLCRIASDLQKTDS